jgi:hypothetical protein
MPRTFDGIDDYVTLATSSISTAGYGTWWAIIKQGADNDAGGFLNYRAASGADTVEIYVGSANQLSYWNNVVSRATTFTVLAAEGWCFLAVTKAPGTTIPRGHKYVYSTRTWTHQNMGDSAADGPSAVGFRVGCWFDGAAYIDDLNGDLAVVGMAGGVALSDAQVEELAYSLVAMQRYATSLWVFDQDATTQKVVDWMGGGADESGLSGTSVATSAVPIFSYGAPVLPVER